MERKNMPKGNVKKTAKVVTVNANGAFMGAMKKKFGKEFEDVLKMTPAEAAEYFKGL